MNKKRTLLLTFALSVVGIVPKFLKHSGLDFGLLGLYFCYIGLSFLAFYTLNTFLWLSASVSSHWMKYSIGFLGGFVLLACFHLLLVQIQPNWITFFLNRKTIMVGDVLMITGFRAFLLQSIAFAYLFFLEGKAEKTSFKSEIELLNQNLNDLKANQVKETAYKSTVITRFKDQVLPIPVSEIAFFHLSSGIVFQCLFSEQKYTQNVSLESLENDLDPNLFFRANRQFLIHRNAVVKIEQIENRKLKVLLSQPTPEAIVISKVKSTAFIKWLEAG